MSIQVKMTTLSQSAAVDQQTGNLSIFDFIEEIRSPVVPFHLPSLVISSMIDKKGKENFSGGVLIHLFTPDGNQVALGNGKLEIPASQRKLKAIFRFGGFPIQQFGSHRLVLSFLDDQKNKLDESILDFDVIQVTQVAQGASSAGSHGLPN